MSARLYSPWFFGGVSGDPERMAAQLNSKMLELEQVIEAMRLSLAYGPVAGAYLPFYFMSDTSPVAAVVQGEYTLPCNVRPLAVSAWVDDPTSQLTITLEYDDGAATAIVGAWQFTGSDFKNARGDFNVDVAPAGAQLRLTVDSVGDNGTPVPDRIAVGFWTKNASRIEPA